MVFDPETQQKVDNTKTAVTRYVVHFVRGCKKTFMSPVRTKDTVYQRGHRVCSLSSGASSNYKISSRDRIAVKQRYRQCICNKHNRLHASLKRKTSRVGILYGGPFVQKKTRVLQTFLGRNCIFSSISKMALAKMHILLNTQFSLKNVARTRVFIFEQPAKFFMLFVQK